MGATVRDWPRLVRQCFAHLEPGGYAEFVEYDLTWTSPDGSLADDSQLKKTNSLFLKALKAGGIEPSAGPLLEGWLQEAGFEDVVVTKHPLPVGMWPANERLVRNIAANLSPFLLRWLRVFTVLIRTRGH